MTPGFTRYTPAGTAGPGGAWTAVSGRGFVAVLASGAPAAVIDALWRLGRDDDVTIEEVVGLIPLAGEGAVRSFVVLTMPADGGGDGRTVTVVVRGTASIDVVSVGGARRFTAGGVQPWVLADFRSVTGFVVGSDEEPPAPTVRPSLGSLPLGDGVVEASRVFWSDREVPPVAPPQPEAPYLKPRAAALDETVIRGRRSQATPRPEFRPDPDAGRDSGAETAAETAAGADDDTRITSGIDDGTGDGTGGTHDPDDTIVRRERREGPASGGRHRLEHDQPPEPALAVTRFRFRLVPGEPEPIDAPTLFGRNPRPPAAPSAVPPRLVTVSSPDQQVSGTHLRLEQVGASVVVTDLRSTNGTVVSGPGIRRARLRPGESRVVLPGTSLDIGDGNIIEIVSPGHET